MCLWKMRSIAIVLLLSTIIPSLDCCTSRPLIDKNPIHFYRPMELSMEASTQLLEESTPAQVTTTPTHTHHRHRHSHENSSSGVLGGPDAEADDKGGGLKLNRPHQQTNEQADLLGQPEQQQQLEQRRRLSGNGSTLSDDGQYKFMDEIIVLECVDWYRLEFCLNGGRCFLYPILNHTLLSCECAGDYVGERCEAKTPEKIPPTIRPRFVLAMAVGGKLVFGLAFVDILLLLLLFCNNSNRK